MYHDHIWLYTYDHVIGSCNPNSGVILQNILVGSDKTFLQELVGFFYLGCSDSIPFYCRKVCIQCNQTGKIFKVEVDDLSRQDDLPLSREDFESGCQLLFEYNKKSYPVTVMNINTSRQSG